MDLQGFGDWDWTADALGEDAENSEDAKGASVAGTQLDGVVFLVDCSEHMFVKTNGESCFELCMKCALNVFRSKVISSDRDLLSIVFYATDKTDSGEGNSIHVFQDLEPLNIKKIHNIDQILQDVNSFTDTYGHSSSYDMSDVFWACSNVFSRCQQKTLGYKRIFLFTNEDNPHKDNQSLQRKATAKATDLQEMGISLELMHMNKVDEKFDTSVFYKNVVYLDEDVGADEANAASKFQDLLDRVNHKVHKKRSLGKVPWTIGEGLEMRVNIYCLTRSATLPTSCRIHRDTNAEVKSSTILLNKDTGDDVMPQDVKMFRTYANKRIAIEKEELAEARKFGIKGLKLVGFKSRDRLKDYFHVKPSHFIYPEEKAVKGSTQLFTALLKKCLDRDVVPVCWYSPRANSSAELVYLLPQAEQKDENNLQTAPPGFHVIFMPFSEDFRDFDAPERPTATPEQVDLMKTIMKKMKFPYDPRSFENPCIQKFQANLEAMALNKDEQEIEDYTLPQYDKMEKRVGKELEAFKAAVFPEGYTGAVKRAASAAGGAAKKPKAEPSDINLHVEATGGRLGKLTVAVLKELCKTNNIKASATKKADIINIIMNHYGL